MNFHTSHWAPTGGMKIATQGEPNGCEVNGIHRVNPMGGGSFEWTSMKDANDQIEIVHFVHRPVPQFKKYSTCADFTDLFQ